MGDILIVPGRGNSGPDHWQTWFEAELPDARRVDQDDWDTPWLLDWVARLHAEIDAAPNPVWLVAHSFGCLAAVAAGFSRAARIRGALLVAPVDPERFGIPAALLEDPLGFPSLVVASDNDPWISRHSVRQLAAHWGSRLVSLGNAGHINPDSGHGPWPEGLQLFAGLRAAT